MKKFEFVEYTISLKFNGKLCPLDVQKVHIWGKIWICCMYDSENSMENCVH